jgi:hypothetical protein
MTGADRAKTCPAFIGKPRNRPAADVVRAANLRKRLVSVIAATDRPRFWCSVSLGFLPSFTPFALVRWRAGADQLAPELRQAA